MPHVTAHHATGCLTITEDTTIPNAAGLNTCLVCSRRKKYLLTDAKTTAAQSATTDVGETMNPMSNPVISDESEKNHVPDRRRAKNASIAYDPATPAIG